MLARAVLIISILFWSFMPPPKTPTLNGKPPAPLPPLNIKKIPTLFPTLTREPTKKPWYFFSKYLFHFYILSLTLFLYYYLCTIYYYLSWISAYQSILPTFYEQLIWLKEKKILLLTTTKTPSFEWKWSPFLTWKL